MANTIQVTHMQGSKILTTEFTGDDLAAHMETSGLTITDGDTIIAMFNEKNWMTALDAD